MVSRFFHHQFLFHTVFYLALLVLYFQLIDVLFDWSHLWVMSSLIDVVYDWCQSLTVSHHLLFSSLLFSLKASICCPLLSHLAHCSLAIYVILGIYTCPWIRYLFSSTGHRFTLFLLKCFLTFLFVISDFCYNVLKDACLTTTQNWSSDKVLIQDKNCV